MESFIASQHPAWIIIFVEGAVSVLIGMLVYIRDRKRKNNTFFLILSLTVAHWAILTGLFEGAVRSSLYETIFLLLTYAAGSSIPLALLYFALTLSTEQKSLAIKTAIQLFVPYLLVIGGLFLPDFILRGVSTGRGIGKEVLFGPGYILYSIYVVAYIGMALFVLYQRFLRGAGIFKAQLKYILWSASLAAFVGFTANIALPFFKNFSFFWAGPTIAVFAIGVLGYLIARYNFWNVKLIATEFLVSVVALTLIAELVLAKSHADFFIKITILVFVLFSGFFLIRSVRRETDAKGEMEKLLKDLADANERLHVLDERKSDFIAIASHHLRDPLTAIKGYASMTLEGSFGAIDERARTAMEKIFESSKRLVTIIEDFMNISKIESGKMDYEFGTLDIKKLVSDVVEEMQPAIGKAGLAFTVAVEEGEDYHVRADLGKLRQVISNLVDNAVKYTPHGSVKIELERNEKRNKILLHISDTGIGMDKRTAEKIFNKFSRAEGVSRVYTEGSGLGLYVAREIMKKHGGKIWAESSGLGRGSIFHLEVEGNGKAI